VAPKVADQDRHELVKVTFLLEPTALHEHATGRLLIAAGGECSLTGELSQNEESGAMHLTKIQLTWDSSLAEYVTQVLQGSRRRLGESILGGMELSDGEWFAWGISGRPFPASFEEGGLMPEAPEDTWIRSETVIAKPIQGARQELCDEHVDYLDANAQHCCSYPMSSTISASR